MFKIYWFVLISNVALLLFAQKVFVYHAGFEKPRTGILFTFPYNTIHLTVEVRQTEYEEGLLSSQARRFFSLSQPLTDNKTSILHELKSIHYSLNVEPDFNRSFLLIPPSRKELNVHVSHYLLLAINDQPAGMIDQPYQFEKSFEKQQKPSFSYLPILENSQWKTDTIKEKTFIDSVIIENIKVITRLTETTIEEKGKELAEAIKKIWRNKIDLNSGTSEVAYDVSTLRYMNQQLDSLMQLYSSLFIGKNEEKTFTYSFVIRPVKENDTIYLFSIDEKRGLLFDSTKSKRYFAVFHLQGKLPAPGLNINSSKKLPGIPYVLPALVRFSIYEEDKEIISHDILIAQFGQVAYLPYRTRQVQFHPLFGYPLKISVGAKFESSITLPPIHYGDGQN